MPGHKVFLGFPELKSPSPDYVLCDLTLVSPALSCIRLNKRKFQPVSFESGFHFFLRKEENWDYPNHKPLMICPLQQDQLYAQPCQEVKIGDLEVHEL